MTKNLTKKQLGLLDDLFRGELNDSQVLEKHKVDSRLYEKWLTDESFTDEFERRLKTARRQSELIIARYASFAAAKLVQLTESQNGETARKACLDVINYLRSVSQPPDAEQSELNQPHPLPPELASRLLAALATLAKDNDTGPAENRLDTEKKPI